MNHCGAELKISRHCTNMIHDNRTSWIVLGIRSRRHGRCVPGRVDVFIKNRLSFSRKGYHWHQILIRAVLLTVIIYFRQHALPRLRRRFMQHSKVNPASRTSPTRSLSRPIAEWGPAEGQSPQPTGWSERSSIYSLLISSHFERYGNRECVLHAPD